MSGKRLLGLQLQGTLRPAVLFYAGSSSSIATSSLVFCCCSASGPAGRMLVTVWSRASICSSVSRSSLSSTICRRKENPPGLQRASQTGPTPTLPSPCCSWSWPSPSAQNSGAGSWAALGLQALSTLTPPEGEACSNARVSRCGCSTGVSEKSKLQVSIFS